MWSILSTWTGQAQTRSHAGIASVVLLGMVCAWTGPYLFPGAGLRNLLLLGTVLLASLPLCIELVLQLKHRNFGVDILAFVSIASAVWLKHYWVAAIVILMFSGGRALEEYATHRASSVLRALARRMPEIAHKES